jgi:hypothetical protein
VKDGSCSNELFWMTTERMEWHSQPTRGDKPCPRQAPCAGLGRARYLFIPTHPPTLTALDAWLLCTGLRPCVRV